MAICSGKAVIMTASSSTAHPLNHADSTRWDRDKFTLATLGSGQLEMMANLPSTGPFPAAQLISDSGSSRQMLSNDATHPLSSTCTCRQVACYLLHMTTNKSQHASYQRKRQRRSLCYCVPLLECALSPGTRNPPVNPLHHP